MGKSARLQLCVGFTGGARAGPPSVLEELQGGSSGLLCIQDICKRQARCPLVTHGWSGEGFVLRITDPRSGIY